MQEVNEENIEAVIQTCEDPEMLKELIAYAMQYQREDLVELIVEKTVLAHRLVEKLQDFQMNPPGLWLDSGNGAG